MGNKCHFAHGDQELRSFNDVCKFSKCYCIILMESMSNFNIANFSRVTWGCTEASSVLEDFLKATVQ